MHRAILEGIEAFAEIFKGELATETILIKGLNDSSKEAEKIVYLFKDLRPEKAYIRFQLGLLLRNGRNL
jgi:wyosine [tRNA(Phe)-imidazoG37] synthetase (radical SAM superfamily)